MKRIYIVLSICLSACCGSVAIAAPLESDVFEHQPGIIPEDPVYSLAHALDEIEVYLHSYEISGAEVARELTGIDNFNAAGIGAVDNVVSPGGAHDLVTGSG